MGDFIEDTLTSTDEEEIELSDDALDDDDGDDLDPDLGDDLLGDDEDEEDDEVLHDTFDNEESY